MEAPISDSGMVTVGAAKRPPHDRNKRTSSELHMHGSSAAASKVEKASGVDEDTPMAPSLDAVLTGHRAHWREHLAAVFIAIKLAYDMRPPLCLGDINQNSTTAGATGTTGADSSAAARTTASNAAPGMPLGARGTAAEQCWDTSPPDAAAVETEPGIPITMVTGTEWSVLELALLNALARQQLGAAASDTHVLTRLKVGQLQLSNLTLTPQNVPFSGGIPATCQGSLTSWHQRTAV